MMPRPDLSAIAAEWAEPRFRDGAESTEDEVLASLVCLLEQVEHNALERAAEEADAAALGAPDNRQQTSPRAAHQAGACKAAWRIRQLKRGGRP